MYLLVRPAGARVPVGGETSVVKHGFWEDNGARWVRRVCHESQV